MELGLENLSLNNYVEIADLNESHVGKTVKLKCFVYTVKIQRFVIFVALREQISTIQAVIEKGENFDEKLFSIADLTNECFVEVIGTVKKTNSPVKSCSVQNIELSLTSLKVLGKVLETLPFIPKDAAATEEERMKNTSFCNVEYVTRLDNRFLDFRLPQTQALIRVIDGFMFLFRDFLRKKKFIEIKTTKIIDAKSEGGSNLFSVNYFKKQAYLAQSPQLYKQMAVMGGLKRVYEIGHVYRAEESNINRYLSEFVGLDLEMELEGTYIDAIKFIHSLFVHIFDSVKAEYAEEIEIIRKNKSFEDIKYNTEPFIITHREAVDLLKTKGISLSYEDDFNREQEKILGAIVKEQQGIDIFVIRDYPASQRAFYTYVDENGATRSYDFILRGEEILSGAQRITDYNKLLSAVEQRNISVSSLQKYLDAFKFGAPPHIGCGIGLERLLKSYFNSEDIRYFSLFPRDPNRITP